MEVIKELQETEGLNHLGGKRQDMREVCVCKSCCCNYKDCPVAHLRTDSVHTLAAVRLYSSTPVHCNIIHFHREEDGFCLESGSSQGFSLASSLVHSDLNLNLGFCKAVL